MAKTTPGKNQLYGRIGVIAVMVFCVLGIIALSYGLFLHSSLQLDEAQSLWQSSHSILGILHTVALDVHVPLYHLLLHFWLLIFGEHISSARILSLVFFIASLPFFYLLARQVLSRKWSLFSLILFSFSPFMLWYSNIARMYSLLALFTTISQYLFLRIMRTNKGWRKYGLSSVIGAYSHYFFSFVLAAEGLYLLYNRKRFAPGSVKRLILVAILVVLALAPWLVYFFILGAAHNTRPLLATPSTVDFFNVYSQFLFGFQDTFINTIILSLWPLLMLIGFLALRRNQSVTPEISFIATMAFLPVITAFVLSLVISPFFLSRYLISAVAPLLILTVWLISYYPTYLRAAIIVLICIITIGANIEQAINPNNPLKENYRSAVSYINHHIHPQDGVIISTPFTIYPFEYYYRGGAPIYTLPLWKRVGSGSIPAFQSKTLPSQVKKIDAYKQNVYLLLSQDQGYQNTIDIYFRDHFKRLYKHVYSPDLTLYVYKMGYEKVAPIGSPSTVITPSHPVSNPAIINS